MLVGGAEGKRLSKPGERECGNQEAKKGRPFEGGYASPGREGKLVKAGHGQNKRSEEKVCVPISGQRDKDWLGQDLGNLK